MKALVNSACAVAIALLAAGCVENSMSKDKVINWKQVEAALKSPDVKTISGLYKRLYREIGEPLSDEMLERLTFHEPFNGHVKYFYQHESDFERAKKRDISMTPEAIHKRLTQQIHWKVPGASLDHVSRVYPVSAREPTKAERIANLDHRIYFHVFADEDGTILGWQNFSETARNIVPTE